MKIIGFNAGQRGDLVMNTVACRAAKLKWPDCKLTFAIGKPFADMAPLFEHHPYIDKVHIWHSYGKLIADDKLFLNTERFDKIFNPMPKHKSENWYNEVSCQTEEVCQMHDLEPPDDLSCYLNKWFEPTHSEQKFICFSPWTAHEPKNLPVEKWEKIVKYITDKGYAAVQLSAWEQARIKGATFRLEGKNYFGAVKALLGSELLITLDSGMNWVSSAYQHPTLGLMGIHYLGQKNSKVYQPINPAATYLEGNHANDIPLEEIFENIDRMLSEKV